MNESYAYAVARIRSIETSLLDKSHIEQLLDCKSYSQCLSFLKDKGFSCDNIEDNYDKILSREMEKVRNLLFELVEDRSLLNVILYPTDYNNLKAIIKSYVMNVNVEQFLLNGGTADLEHIIDCIKRLNFSELGEGMSKASKEAFETLVHTSDGQLCDVIIDKALIEAINNEAGKTKSKFVKKYAEFVVASSDIKIALRAQKMNKDLDFLNMALVNCSSLDASRLAMAATQGKKDILKYLETTSYFNIVPYVDNSIYGFERWYERELSELIENERYNSFTIGPIISYYLKKEKEIKAIRIILAGKFHGIDKDLMKGRLNILYG